jgi:hypothetical protein
VIYDFVACRIEAKKCFVFLLMVFEQCKSNNIPLPVMKTVSVFYLIGQNVRAKENELVIQSFCSAINRLYIWTVINHTA